MKTPLYNWHKENKGKIVDFAGWEMPIQYSGLIEEHNTVRGKVGLFDVSHMGELFVQGSDAEAFLQFVTTNDVSKLKSGDSQYTLLLNNEGGVVDDIIVYKIDSGDFMLCVNASNTQKDFDWINQYKSKFSDVKIMDKSSEFGLIALQGPAAEKVIGKLCNIEPSVIKKFSFIETGLQDVKVFLSRTGYTGEDGFEIFCPWNQTELLWNCLMEAGQSEGIAPIGLGARDTLRIEVKYPLYGHEITDQTNPYEAKLAWTVRLDKGDFIGKPALLKIKEKGIARSSVCLVLQERGIPRDGYTVLSGDKEVGIVTSGTFSPSLKKGIAIASVEKAYTDIDRELNIQIRKDIKIAKLIKAPFYCPKKKGD
jgi:aminomethyltransferase